MHIIDLDNPQHDITACSLDERSFDISRVTLTIVAPDIRTRCPYSYNDIYQVRHKGRVIIEGPCSDPDIDAESCAWTISICDYFDFLDRTPYLGATPSQIDTTPGRPTQYTFSPKQPIGTILVQDADEGIKTTMQDILRAAQTVDILPADYDVRVSAYEMIPRVTSSATYASILLDIHDWIPNTVSYFDYVTSARPTLIIADPDAMPVIDIHIDHVDLSGLQIKARHDLVPPVVAVVGTDTDSMGCGILVNSICPKGGNLNQPGNLIIQVDSGNLPQVVTDPPDPDDPEAPDPQPKPTSARRWDNPPSMIIKGAAIPVSGDKCREFWARHAQPLADIKDLVIGLQKTSPTPTTGEEGKNYSADATRYELTEGLISNKTAGIKWCKIYIRQALGYPGTGCPQKYDALFPETRKDGHRWGWHTLEMVTTNVRRKEYKIGGKYEESDPPEADEPEEDEDDPPPVDIPVEQSARYDQQVDSYYAATRVVPYDGTIPLLTARPDIRVGARINVIGAYPEWETMQAIVQSIHTDLIAKTQTLTIGPPKHLRLDKVRKQTQSLASQAEETKEESTPAANGSPTFSWDYQIEKKKKTENPGIAPYTKYIPPSTTPQLNADFAVRAVTDEDGNIAYQVHSGKFVGIATGISVPCGTDWQDCGDKEVWANLETDKGGVPTRAYFTDKAGTHRPWFPRWNNDNEADGLDLGRTLPGFYSYRVASIASGQITQHVLGSISITYYTKTLAFG